MLEQVQQTRQAQGVKVPRSILKHSATVGTLTILSRPLSGESSTAVATVTADPVIAAAAESDSVTVITPPSTGTAQGTTAVRLLQQQRKSHARTHSYITDHAAAFDDIYLDIFGGGAADNASMVTSSDVNDAVVTVERDGQPSQSSTADGNTIKETKPHRSPSHRRCRSAGANAKDLYILDSFFVELFRQAPSHDGASTWNSSKEVADAADQHLLVMPAPESSVPAHVTALDNLQPPENSMTSDGAIVVSRTTDATQLATTAAAAPRVENSQSAAAAGGAATDSEVELGPRIEQPVAMMVRLPAKSRGAPGVVVRISNV